VAMTERPEDLQPAFALDPALVSRLLAGELDIGGQTTLAEQVAHLMPFHAELPMPLVAWLQDLVDHIGGEAALIEWLNNFPGLPRKVARLLVFASLLDQVSAEPAIVTALTELRQRTPYPPGLRRYLVPDTNSATLSDLGTQIEGLLAQDKADEAVRLALDTAAMLTDILPRATELNPGLAGLRLLISKARQDLREIAADDRLFRDRRVAGRVLAGWLEKYRNRDDVVVLGLPRGGVPVAYEVATALGAPLDIFLVGKLGLPQRPDITMGAIAGGVVALNDDVVRAFDVEPETVKEVADREGREVIVRERSYRDGTAAARLTGQTVIVVDDGQSTGACMQAAVQAICRLRPAHLTVALPATSKSTYDELALEVDDVISATKPSPFFAVGSSYWDFTQTTDEQVRDLLRAARTQRAQEPAPPH
jgi:predicted phosphoribosyltransferase